MTDLANKPRILVVENEAIIALDIRLQLVELGFEPVGHETQGEQAIFQAGHLRPDLVLMDIQLSGSMDGIAAAHAIQTQFLLPVVLLSAFSEHDVMTRARLVKPYGYILKPFTQWEMRTVIEIALYKHQKELNTCCCGLHAPNHRPAADCLHTATGKAA